MVTNIHRVEVIRNALDKMSQAAELLEEFVDDPRMASVIRELEGCDLGWAPPDPAEDDYLFDRLGDLFVEAGGRHAELERNLGRKQ